ncbi:MULTISPECIES: helix-turn-helix domain-containing protein [Luteimonas]|uniref:helix-turn-helix domain-containing protein n=1 Tax=Luteimonas TaxID=83614 RepID=UPI000C798E06|nr:MULTISPECIES: AraC family transcriptional regulator [Luteimonas]
MTFWIVMYAIGAAQAAMLSLALWRRTANPQANRVLSVWLLLVATDLALKAAYLGSPSGGLRGAFHATRLLPFLYVSLFFIYVRALTTGRGFAPADILHAGGFLGASVWAVWLLWSNSTMAHGRGWTPAWFDPVQFAWAAAYLLAALVRVHRYRRRKLRQRADADRGSLQWIVLMAACQLVIWGIAAVHVVLRLPYVDYFLIYGAVAAWVCVVGWCSLAQPPVVALSVDKEVVADAPLPVLPDDSRTADVEARLSQLMTGDAFYREPALTIAQLARRSGYPEYLVSAVINRRFGGNFWDYVNRHRIEAVRVRLSDPQDGRTILDIAYDAGFTSKSTFNASFKRLLGVTPSAYRRRSAHLSATDGAEATHTPPD